MFVGTVAEHNGLVAWLTENHEQFPATHVFRDGVKEYSIPRITAPQEYVDISRRMATTFGLIQMARLGRSQLLIVPAISRVRCPALRSQL